MKVRLVRPLIAEIAQLDTVATESVDPVGPATSGYDEDFREPVLAAPSEGIGVSQRQEKPTVQIPVQVEVGSFERLRQSFSGDLPDSRLALVMDYEDLERLNMIEATTNESSLRKNDRVTRILNKKGQVIESFPDPPGLYVTELRPAYGLNHDRNILVAFCDERDQGLARGV